MPGMNIAELGKIRAPLSVLQALFDYKPLHLALTPEQREASFKARERQYMLLPCVVEKRMVDRDNLRLTATVSMETPDRLGDRVFVEGWDLNNFKKNPVVMWVHDYDLPPIGTAVSMTKAPPSLIAEMQFWSGDGQWGDFSREIFDMYASEPANMRAFSVGYIPWDYQVRYEKDPESGDDHFAGFDITRAELLEFSAVPIPMHQDALAMMMKALGANVTKDTLATASRTNHQTIANVSDRPDSAALARPMAELQAALTTLWASTERRALRARRNR